MYQSIVVRDAFSASNCDAPNNSSRQNKESFYDRVKKENIIYTRLIILSLASLFPTKQNVRICYYTLT